MSHLFHEYGPDRGEIAARKNGSLVSMETARRCPTP
jgi:predicted membrane GTPase involved in stress response